MLRLNASHLTKLGLRTFIGGIARNRNYIFSVKRCIAYVGWLGYGNLGDEAMFYSFKKLFSGFDILPFKSSAKTESIEKFTGRKLYNAIALGGGTLINSGFLKTFKAAQARYFPSFVFGAGVRSPEYWRRIDRESNNLDEWVDCLRACAYVSVRGPLSKRFLEDGGFREVEVTGDPALSLSKRKIKKRPYGKRLGINIGVAGGNLWGKESDVLDFIVKFAKIKINQGWDLVFLPVSKNDIPYIEEAVRRTGKDIPIFYQYESLKKTLNLLESCDLFVGEKLHSVIFAMCANTPAVMLEYRPKCLDFMMSMGLKKFNMRTDRLSLDLLMDLTQELHDHLDDFRNMISVRVGYYRELQAQKAKMISKLLKKNG